MATAWFRRSNQKSAPTSSSVSAPTSPQLLSPAYAYSHPRNEEQRYIPRSQPQQHLSPTGTTHPPPSSYSNHNSSHARPKSSQSRSGNQSSLTLGSIFGLSKSKRPSTSHGEGSPREASFGTSSQGSSHSKLTVVDRIPSPSNAGGTFAINEISPYSSSRARAQTVSSTSTRPPLTPADSADHADRPVFRRDRSDSSVSDFNSNTMARKAQQMPSLLHVEQYDPFATHSDSVYVVSSTPPVHPYRREKDSGAVSPFQQQQARVPIDPSFRPRPADNGYIEGSITGRPPAVPSGPGHLGTSPLKIMPRRPSAPPSFNPTSNTLAISPVTPNVGPSSAGPTTKKHLPLPFRAKSQKEKSRNDVGDASAGYLLPKNSASASRIYRYSGTSTNSAGSNSANSSATHLPLSPGQTTAEHLAVNSIQLDPTSSKTHVPPPIPTLHLNTTEPRLGPQSGANGSMSPVALSPTEVNVNAVRTHLSQESKASLDGRNKRLRAALAVSVQELSEDLALKKSPRNSDGSSSGPSPSRPPDLDLSAQTLPQLHFDGPSPVNGRSPALTPKEVEHGTYELLVPPKAAFNSEKNQHVGTPTSVYGAPSFIAEPLMSPGDHFFASPYPSGLATVPIPFALFGRKSEDSAAAVRPSISEDMHSQESEVVLMGKSVDDQDFVARLGHSPILEQFPSPPTTSPPSSRKSSASGVSGKEEEVLEGKSERMARMIMTMPEMQTPVKQLAPIAIPPRPPVNAKSPLSSSVTSPITADSPDSPLFIVPTSAVQPFASRPKAGLGQNPDANVSTLSFSSSVSGGIGDSSPVFAEEEDEDSDLDDFAGKKSRSGSRSRRGSEGASGFLPIGTSFGTKSALKSFRSTTPPPLPTKVTPNLTPSHTPSSKSSILHQAAVGVGLRRPRTGSSSSGLIGMNIGSSPVFTNLMSTLSLTSSTHSGAGDEKAPRKQKSFNVLSPPLPPVPPLRHCNSFNPPSSTTNSGMDAAGAYKSDVEGNGHGSKKKGLTRRSSRTSVTKSLGLGFGDRSVSGGSEGKFKKSQSGHQASQSSGATMIGDVGPKGEIVEKECEWPKENLKSKFAARALEDDTRSLMTLNAIPGHGLHGRGSIDDASGSGSSWWEDGRPFSPDHTQSPVSMLRSVSTPFSKSAAAINGLRQKSVSPTRNDFRPMHIMDPSELIKVGREAENGGLGAKADYDDDLMKQDFEDFVSSANGVLGEDLDGGQTWLSELGALDGAVAVGINARLIQTSATRRGAASVNRGLPHRPKTGNGRSDSIKSHASSLPLQRRRPSTSQASMSSIPTLSSVLGSSSGHSRSLVPGGPLAPPPPRSRLPTRTSISSSMRSLPMPIPSSNTPGPLSPPPPRARALSGGSNRLFNQVTGGRRTSDSTVTGADLSRAPSQATTTSVASSAYAPKRVDSLRRPGIRNNRQSMKPSFLDIEFEDDDAEGPGKAGAVDSSFLDMDRGNSMETTRDEYFFDRHS
ncbi:hypothetical protein FRC03_009541 [Tulasnella sp. 419]|nr:hypothetical protein FRC03_009541 [Tulasnella sp. 419]